MSEKHQFLANHTLDTFEATTCSRMETWEKANAMETLMEEAQKRLERLKLEAKKEEEDDSNPE